jgi:hypothetical protein
MAFAIRMAHGPDGKADTRAGKRSEGGMGSQKQMPIRRKLPPGRAPLRSCFLLRWRSERATGAARCTATLPPAGVYHRRANLAGNHPSLLIGIRSPLSVLRFTFYVLRLTLHAWRQAIPTRRLILYLFRTISENCYWVVRLRGWLLAATACAAFPDA